MLVPGTTRPRSTVLGALLAGASIGVVFACTSYSSATDDASDGGTLDPGNDKDGSGTCEAPNKTCGPACVDTTKDDSNCGACGKKCDVGYVCTASNCEIACSIGFSPCRGAVPDGDAGDAGNTNDAQADVTTGDAAATNPTGPYCANLTTDPINCGTCGNTCLGGKICTSGVCCNGDQQACSGACTRVASDPNNCGTCGKVCPANTPFCSAGACIARYTIVGVQLNVPETDATRGWTPCFSEQYDQSTPLAAIMAACSKNNVMMACRQNGAPNLQVLAQAPRGDVFFNTGDGNTAKHEANGVAWYMSDNASFGFAPAGVDIDRNSCDWVDSYAGSAQQGTGQGDKRMCTHTGGGSTQGGWRCGRDNALSTGWQRIFYHTD